MTLGADELIRLAQVGGVGLALALMIVLLALWRQLLWIGPTVLMLLAEKERQIVERDRRITLLTEQVEERQRMLDKTLELATILMPRRP